MTPVVPLVPMSMDPPAMAMAHNLRAGHKLVLRVTASDPDKVPTFAFDPNITVHAGPSGTVLSETNPSGTVLRVTIVSNPTLVPDNVPFEVLPKKPGNAQSTIRTFVSPPAAGPERLHGVTSVHTDVFVVEEGKDNNRLVVGAVPSLPADIDLYLEKEQAD